MTDTVPGLPPAPIASLAARMTTGAVWLLSVRWGSRLLRVVSTLVLARLLTPVDFGVVALAVAFSEILGGVTALPAGQALIALRQVDRGHYDTAWTLAALRGLALAALMLVAASPVAALLDEPRLALVITVLALQPLLEGLANPRFIDFQKELKFSKVAIVDVGTTVVVVAATIAAALILRSYWAMIIGTLVSVTVRLLWTYWLKPYLPRPTLREFRALFGFSAWLTASSVIWTINLQFDKFVVGGLLGTASVGLYRLGQELCRLPSRELLPALGQVLFPGLATLAHDPARLRGRALEASAVIGAMILPMGVGFGLVANEVVRLVLGAKWLEIIPMIQLMAPLLTVPALTIVLNPLVMASRRTHVNFVVGLWHFLARTTFVGLGAYGYGFDGAVYGYAFSAIADFGIRLRALSRELGVPFWRPVFQVWRSLLSVAVMAGAVLGVGTALPVPEGSLALGAVLAAKMATGGITYVLVHAGLWWAAGRPKDGAEHRVLSAGRAAAARLSARRRATA